jgi:hypothetical protein
MTHADTMINALVGIAYAYAVELNEAAIHADHDELEQLAHQITDKLKAQLRVALEEQQAAAPAAVPAEPKGVTQVAPQQAAPTESVLIDGIAYDTPAPVAAELLRLHIDAQQAVPVAQWDGVDEALRCAEWLEHIAAGGEVVEIDGLARASAAELRRLHAQAGELRELLQDAKRAMTELHQAAIPDESAEGVPAIIPPEAFRKFVDAHAMLCFCMHQRGHNPPKGGQQHG